MKGSTLTFKTPSLPLLLAFLSSMISGVALSAQVYQWTDENGTVHFGSSPPPAVMKEKDVKVVEEVSSGEGKLSDQQLLYGKWFATVDGRTTRRVTFQTTRFRIEDMLASSSGSVGIRPLASGKYELQGRAIKVVYFENPEDPSKLDQTAIFEILDIEENYLRLLTPNNRVWHLKALNQAEPTQFSTDIKGRWQDNKGAVYDFDHGIFHIRKPMPRSGNWSWEDPDIILEFIADFQTPIDQSTTQNTRWRLKSRSYEKMEFIETGSGEEIVLSRIR